MSDTYQNPDKTKPENQVVLDAGKLIGGVAAAPIELNGRHFAIVPAGCGLQDISAALPRGFEPDRQRKFGVITVASVDAFCDYVTKHRSIGDNDTLILVDVTASGAQFTAILNHHGDKPGFSDHRVSYLAKHSVEWNRWMSQDRKQLSQQVFAEHIEECAKLIVTPAGTDLLSLIADLSGHADVNFTAMTNLQNGSMRCAYEEIVEVGSKSAPDSGKVEIPKVLGLAIVPFENPPKNTEGQVTPYSLNARLKLKLASRKLTFTYESVDTHLIVQDAVNALLETVKAKTFITPMLGSASIQ